MPAVSATVTAVVLDGRRLRCPATGEVLCELDDDGAWRTPAGEVCRSLEVLAPSARPAVDEDERARARRAHDRAWLDASLPALERLARGHEHVTSDDLWAVLEQPPVEPKQIGLLLKAAARHGWLEPTDDHRPSRRGANHGRPVRVWRSLLVGQTALTDLDRP